eukprot:TRINITY_DN14852_c0_g1_i5.p1 TRINITY_DN14852_c0_g1~~TRINITY_DN14852_c0_g1_i5.p1  ORF type:complete len:234 (+),score=33.79 TRINITY_DN14852_c0_g1_i5:36-704(+)
MQPSGRIASALRTCAPFSNAISFSSSRPFSQLRQYAARDNGVTQKGSSSEHSHAVTPAKRQQRGHGGALHRRRWRPSLFSLLDDLDAQMGLSMDPFNSFATQFEAPARSQIIALDVFETDDHVEIHADLPGVAKKDIKIESNRDVLTLSVQHQSAKEESGDDDGDGRKWYRSERSQTWMQRSIRLPEHADGANASASYEDGVLKIKVPKREKASEGTEIAVQ